MSDGSMRFREALSWGKTRMHSSAGHVCGKPKDIRANQNGACSSNAQDRHSMPGRGLEPLRISPPDPKSGASANFATLASLIYSDLRIIHSDNFLRVLEVVLESRRETSCYAEQCPPGRKHSGTQ